MSDTNTSVPTPAADAQNPATTYSPVPAKDAVTTVPAAAKPADASSQPAKQA